MSVRSWRGVGGGIAVALVVPVSYGVMARLIESGTVAIDRAGSLFRTSFDLRASASLALVLGLLGIVIAGRAAGVHHALAWVALVILGIAVVALAWFIGFAMFSGAMGSPF